MTHKFYYRMKKAYGRWRSCVRFVRTGLKFHGVEIYADRFLP